MNFYEFEQTIHHNPNAEKGNHATAPTRKLHES